MPGLDKTIDRQALYLSEKKKVGKYNHAYTDFVESVTLEDFQKIEKWKSLFGSGGSPTKVNREIARHDIQNQPENGMSFNYKELDIHKFLNKPQNFFQ